MKHRRTIVVKALFNPDEYTDFSKQCEADDVPQSKQLRDLAADWLARRNDKTRQHHHKRPGYGHVMAMVLPSRGMRSAYHVRN